jgi:hypothetical protein
MRHSQLTIIGLVLLLMTFPIRAQDQTPDAQKFAESALNLFDAGECSKLYDAFDESARNLTREQWMKVCSDTLKQRGSVVNRGVPSKTKSMGIYRFVYSTQCTNGKVFEDVGVISKNSEWKLVGFVVRPNLE